MKTRKKIITTPEIKALNPVTSNDWTKLGLYHNETKENYLIQVDLKRNRFGMIQVCEVFR